MRVRRARRSDLHAMSSVHRAAGASAWAHIFPAERLAQNEPPRRWQDAVEEGGPGTAVFVA
jgi:hypothetical protein